MRHQKFKIMYWRHIFSWNEQTIDFTIYSRNGKSCYFPNLIGTCHLLLLWILWNISFKGCKILVGILKSSEDIQNHLWQCAQQIIPSTIWPQVWWPLLVFWPLWGHFWRPLRLIMTKDCLICNKLCKWWKTLLFIMRYVVQCFKYEYSSLLMINLNFFLN